MVTRTKIIGLMGLSLILGCAEEKEPQHVKMFPGASRKIAPSAPYYLTPPPKGPILYYMEVPTAGQVPDGRLKIQQKFEVLPDQEEVDGGYVKVTFGSYPDPGEVIEPGDLTEPVEAYIESRFVPAGRLQAATKVEVVEATERYVKVKTIDGVEGYVMPKFVKRIEAEG